MDKAFCNEECLSDCNCQVALFRGQECKKLMSLMRYAKTARKGFATMIIKLQNGSSEENTTMVGKGGNGEVSTGVLMSSLSVSSFGLVALAKATNGFTDQVGKGAFGTVFKGVLISKSSRKVVAIKRLEKVIADGEREFGNEMKVIGQAHSRNLVKLLGYCHEGTNRLLVYEYMTNGSLAGFLFGFGTKPTWEERIGIVLNITKGILYLHEECETQIIHCDIKPENILMDEQNCTKIADFGLAKLLMPDQTRTYTGFRGTRGMLQKECRNGCSQRQSDSCQLDLSVFLDGELDKLVEDEDAEKIEVVKMMKLGLWCIQEELYVRPSMKKVCLMLEGTIEIPLRPNPTSSVSWLSVFVFLAERN
ncbi:hypothetical protein TIFTF001_020382 [Ficus carica]|uniref:non-specific serine/threonine protein kinase n=1 Tax=Ficus carica TaxID=3494 RepID=A0AA88A8I5_FICCA|nr:hypothetical protein TIFTF001_020382 [Ficus carica]